ncbi:hypothetical protein TanjilG_24944 [Lupinus angustifolius]|uniref:ZCF37 n=1 Tax=Lupinus angustifolius TaxID=3871 RepID=A0A394DBX2_LUPAN|nr:PREDICTED: uncharacterized protein LOC109338968 [Lupinus angustifolius]OIW20866.1 hypothetical protein TanjilG_24944 [Lupinus angustifolius]
MLKPFVCGTFHHEDDDNPLLVSPGFSPRKSKRKYENPYSTRGLDKFSELLADLDEKRQKIYSEMNPNDISFVRFVYSNTDDFVPIVVKVKNKDHHKQHRSEELRVIKARHLTPSESMNKSTTESNAAIVEEIKQQPKLELEAKESTKNFSWNMKKWDMWKPYFYVPIVIILILMLLTMFGRSFATLCTCVLWYIIPTLKDSSSLNPRKSMQKKDHIRGLSEIKKVVVTNEVNTNKKKDYVRGFSEKKMVVNEGMKKKDYIRRWSGKKIETEGLVSLTSDHSPEASKNYKSITAKHGYKKSW